MKDEIEDIHQFVFKVRSKVYGDNPCVIKYGLLEVRTISLKEHYIFSVR